MAVSRMLERGLEFLLGVIEEALHVEFIWTQRRTRELCIIRDSIPDIMKM